MAEYTYEDIIMDPEDPRLEGAIGKECYFSDYPKQLLNGARNNSPEYLDCLTDIRKEAACTFVDKNGSGWILIIIKKEEPKPKYVPFENMEEFLEACRRVEINWLEANDHYLSKRGIWLNEKKTDAYSMVTEIWDGGVVIASDQNMTFWGKLCENYTFLDGSPCGKEVK